MWKRLVQKFTKADPITPITREFMEMLEHTRTMSQRIHPHLFDPEPNATESREVYELDVKVNKLERSIRKRIINHLNLSSDKVSYCLLMMSIIKDAERIGDYLKNIYEVRTLTGVAIPPSHLRAELESVIALVVDTLNVTPEIIAQKDVDEATKHLQAGRSSAQRCDKLLSDLAQSNLSAAEVTSMVLLTRFHKRLGAHLLNILSSVVMPLHKLDFYDGRQNPTVPE